MDEALLTLYPQHSPKRGHGHYFWNNGMNRQGCSLVHNMFLPNSLGWCHQKVVWQTRAMGGMNVSVLFSVRQLLSQSGSWVRSALRPKREAESLQ